MPVFAVRPGTAMGTRVQRMVQLDQIRAALGRLAFHLANAQRDRRECLRLESISRGLYEELNKLCASGPDVPVTPLALDEVNCVLEEAILLLKSDAFINRFIRAFDPRLPPPVHRDVVLALRSVRQGLERCRAWLDARIDTLDSRIAQAEAIRGALEYSQDWNNGIVLRRDLEKMGGNAHPDWFRDYPYNLSDFDFSRLNATDILRYFLAEL